MSGPDAPPADLTPLGDPAELARRLAASERDNAKLRRINKALMDRVERSMDFQGGAFSLFQTAIVLESKVRERTLELERAMQALAASHRDLARAKELAETMRARLSEAIESINEGFALFDGDDRLIICNRRYLSFWPAIGDQIRSGMRFSEIAALASAQSVADEAGRAAADWLSLRLSQHGDPGGPHVHRLSDGRWLQINERRTRDGGVVGVYTDITAIKELETRRRERELAEKSALLQATLDNIVQGVSVFDRSGLLVAWNERFVELLGLPPGSAQQGAAFEALIGRDAAPPLIAALSGEALGIELPWLGRVLEVSRNPMPDGGFVATFSDITERKAAELALRDGERRIRLITDAVPAMIAYVDAYERYRFVNRAYEDWFNRPSAAILNRAMRDALSPLEYEIRRPYVKQALAGEKVSFELEQRDSLGAKRYAVAVYVPHFGDRGDVLGFFTLIHDITDRRKAAEALKDAKDSLERRVAERTAELTRLNDKLHMEIRDRAAAETAARMAKAAADQANLSKTKFLAAASHDLLQPLNAARLFVSALEDLDQPAPARALVENVGAALCSVEDLLSALLDITKLDAGAVTPELESFPIMALLGALATEYAPVAQERGLDLRVVGSTAVVRSDIRMLRRIVQNFVANALRYTRSGRVLVGCRRGRDGVRVEVWDTGPGVPHDKQQEIFREFHRLDAPGPEERHRGMGLGLAIVDRMAGMLGHPIALRSWVGRGSVFAVTVPYGARLRAAPPRPTPTPTAAFNQLAGARVLVLDNEPAVVSGMEALLGGWSCAVTSAACGDDALARLAAAPQPPDLLIADYHLDHGADGLSEIARLRAAAGVDIPAILITANRASELAEQAQAAGCALLYKPARPAQLRAVMTTLIGMDAAG